MSALELNAYLDKMSESGTWGDGVMLSAAVQLYGRPVEILAPDGRVSHVDMAEPSTDVEPILLGLAADHYVSIRKIGDCTTASSPSSFAFNESLIQPKILHLQQVDNDITSSQVRPTS